MKTGDHYLFEQAGSGAVSLEVGCIDHQLVGLAGPWRPAQPIAGHEDDAAHDPTIIQSRYAMRQREIRLNPAHLRLAQHP
jgi:hypothetical protein